jgi:hypothetical protein
MSKNLTDTNSLISLSSTQLFEQVSDREIYAWARCHLQSLELKHWLGEEEIPLPEFPGLYFIDCIVYDCEGKSQENLAYIGVANTSIRQRWKSHHQLPLFTRLQSMGVEVIIRSFPVLPGTIPTEMLQQWERGLIEKLHPIFNDDLV